MSILFYLRHNRMDKRGKVPVYFRITIAGKRLPVGRYTGQKVLPSKWQNNREKGNTATNLVLESIEQKLNLIYASQLASGQLPTVESVMTAFDGKAKIGFEQLAELFFEHCKKLSANARLDKEERVCLSTINTYRYKFNHIRNYYNAVKKPIPPAETFTATTLQVIADWLRQECPVPLQRSTIARVVSVMKKISQFGYKQGHLADDLLKNFTYVRGADKAPVSISIEDVQRIWTYPYSDDLQPIADMFVLQCYTGMYLADLMGLTVNNITTLNGRPYLVYNRAKNGQKATVPFFDPAALVLKKYNFVLPKINKDYYNQLLKRVGDKAGVQLSLTMKIGRKTFANLAKNHWGYSTTAVAAMLGHVKEETQQHYARPGTERVVMEYEKLVNSPLF
ncbi:site-specific integrase [Oscillatoria amoena NRMC-F 0135]|nr:site-specific integrase [Oscillatoria amoena NRMC-F 0135]